MRLLVSRYSCTVLLLFLGSPVCAEDGWLVRFADALDLNDYALTAEIYASQSPYSGVDNFQILYPLLRSFGSSIDSESTLYLRNSYAGIRHVTENDWVFGVVGTVQTLGYGSEDSDVFSGMDRRDWTLQAGINIGKRFDRFAVDLFATTDILGQHKGSEFDLLFGKPFSFGRWELAPQIGLTYQDSSFVNYYFGVRTSEFQPGLRPAYKPGSAITPSARLGYSYRINDRWFLTASAAVRFLPDEITDSPLVDRDTTTSFSLGVSYDAPAFSAIDDTGVDREGSAVELIANAFLVRSKSKLDLQGQPGVSVPRLERQQELDATELVFPVEAIWQWGRLHRIDFRAFVLSRGASARIIDPITINNVTFGPDETVTTKLRTRVMRLGYGLSILRDEQKELSIMGGIHVADINYRVNGVNESIKASTTPVLPVLGVRGRVNFTDKISVEANIEAFALDFDAYSGELFDVSISGRYRMSDPWFTGVGYRYYRHNIRSGDQSLFGEYQIDYQGPFAYLGAHF